MRKKNNTAQIFQKLLLFIFFCLSANIAQSIAVDKTSDLWPRTNTAIALGTNTIEQWQLEKYLIISHQYTLSLERPYDLGARHFSELRPYSEPDTKHHNNANRNNASLYDDLQELISNMLTFMRCSSLCFP